MTLIAHRPLPGLYSLTLLRNLLWPGRKNSRVQPDQQEEEADRENRDLILEILDRHPDAFLGESDLESMARLCGGRF
jgi:hypothetical protein